MSILDAGGGGVVDTSTPTANALSDDDYQNILRTVYGEAGNQGPAGWSAVANVIKNRLAAGTYGNTASAVVQAPKQFSVWNDGTPALPDDATSAKMMPIIKAAFTGDSPDPTNGATNYYANKGPNAIAAPAWAQGVSNPIQIGDQVFMKVPGGSSPAQTSSNSSATPVQPDATGGQGAFNANFLTNGVGTLFGMSPMQSHDIGNRIERASAALASISDPGQASVLASLQQKPVANTWTDIGAAPNKQGRIQQNSLGQVRYQPYPTAADANAENPDLKPGDFNNLTRLVTTTEGNRQLVDTAHTLMNQLASDPNIYKSINGLTGVKNFIANAQGSGGPASEFYKNAVALINRSIELSAGGPGMGTATRSVHMQKVLEKAMAPNGATMDPNLLYGVLQRIAQMGTTQYDGSINTLNGMYKKFGDKMPFNLDASGKPAVYDKAVRDIWKQQESDAAKAYSSKFKPWYDNRVNGVTTPQAPAGGMSRVQAIQQMYSNQHTAPGTPPQPAPAPAAPIDNGPYPNVLGVPWQPGMPIQ